MLCDELEEKENAALKQPCQWKKNTTSPSNAGIGMPADSNSVKAAMETGTTNRQLQIPLSQQQNP